MVFQACVYMCVRLCLCVWLLLVCHDNNPISEWQKMGYATVAANPEEAGLFDGF